MNIDNILKKINNNGGEMNTHTLSIWVVFLFFAVTNNIAISILVPFSQGTCGRVSLRSVCRTGITGLKMGT